MTVTEQQVLTHARVKSVYAGLPQPRTGVKTCGTVLAGRKGGKKLLQLQLFFCDWRVSEGRVQTFDRFMALAELEITQMLGREF